MTRGHLVTRLIPAILAGVACARTVARTAHGVTAPAVAQGVALRRLFVEREHARQLVLWSDAEPGPVFDALGLAPTGPPGPSALRALTVALRVPVTLVGTPGMTQLFRAHPDGWAAFYATYAGAPGLVEIAPVDVAPARASAPGVASVVVGRACGEHCRHAWRVTLRAVSAAPGPAWQVTAVTPLRVPGTR